MSRSMERGAPRYTSQEHDSDGSWAISYGDMITLLLSFFVIYFSTDFNKKTEESLGHRVVTDLEVMKNEVGNLPEFIASNKEVLKTMNLEVNDGEDIAQEVQMKVHKVGNSILIYFQGISFFDSGRIDLRQDASVVLSEFAKKIEPYLSTYKVKIRAFTDTKKVNYQHRYRDNLELSALRSVSAMRVLERAGVPRRRIEVSGHGPMSLKLLDSIGVSKDDIKLREALSRSVMILLKRENYVPHS